jgi:hypothetical protein
MNKSSFHQNLEAMVEAEQQAGFDQALLDNLHLIMQLDTMYFDMTPERRNTLNKFFREIHTIFEGELAIGRYGASILIDALIVSTFEAGYRLGEDENTPTQAQKLG